FRTTSRCAARVLGSIANTKRAASHRFLIPETTFGSARSRFSEKRLGGKELGVMGDPNAKVSCVQLKVGCTTPAVNNPHIVVDSSGELQETTARSTLPSTFLTPYHSGFRKAGSCWAMRSRKTK